MSTTDEHQETAETTSAVTSRMPRMGAGASGLVSLLLVAAVFALPFFGLIVAPLGLIPVLHFQSSGAPGVRAWGWVVVMLVIGSMAGIGPFPLLLLATYAVVVVLPAISVELRIRTGLGEARWIAATVMAGCLLVVVGVAIATLPSGPVEVIATAIRGAEAQAKEMYGAAGVAEADIELAIDSMVHIVPWVFPSVLAIYLTIIVFWVRPRLPLLGYPFTVVVFEQYRGDEWLAAVFSLAGLGTLLLDGTARWLALNLLIAVLVLYFVQGLAMIRAHLARWLGRGWFVRWGVALLCLMWPMPVFVTVLGVADSFFPLRPAVSDDGGNP
jgi:hypothetical protein